MRWPSRIALTLSVSTFALASIVMDGVDAQDRGESAGAPDGQRSAGVEERTTVAHATITKRAPRTERRVRRTRTTTRRRATSARRAPREPVALESTSIGRHNSGRLLNGRPLLESEHVRLKRPTGETAHGTDEMVALLERAAAAVAEQHPGARLTVGDLSRRGGGRFAPHRSHRTGRDVDIGFYIVDASGAPVYQERFVDFRPDGTTRANPEWRFDDARNWALVAALLGQDESPVQYMFVARWLKQRLLDHAVSIGAPQELIDRATIVLDQPSRGGRHEDHFHTRIYCPASDRPRCLDDAPFHAWVPRPSAEQMVAIRAASVRSRAARARVARAEARRRDDARSRRRARHARSARGVSERASAEPTLVEAAEGDEIPGG